jgi:hypothetical protein
MGWLIGVWGGVAVAEITGLVLIFSVLRDVTRPARAVRREAKNLDREPEDIRG